MTNVGKFSTILETLKLRTFIILVKSLIIVKSGTSLSTHGNLKTHILTHSVKKTFFVTFVVKDFVEICG